MPNIQLGTSDYLRRAELDGFAVYLSSSGYLLPGAGPLLARVIVLDTGDTPGQMSISHRSSEVAITTILIS